jgi:hypothetical protein
MASLIARLTISLYLGYIQCILGESQFLFDLGAHEAWCEGAMGGIASAEVTYRKRTNLRDLFFLPLETIEKTTLGYLSRLRVSGGHVITPT